MREVLLGALAFSGFSLAFYLAVGAWAAGRFRRGEKMEDRLLSRLIRRATGSLLLATGLLVWLVAAGRPRIPPIVLTILLYLLPLLFAWVNVLGASWIEMRARGVGMDLWRFHRFNLFSGYLLRGQRIPYLSAAVAAPAYVLAGADPRWTTALHLAIAFLTGLAVRWALVNLIAGVRPFPDARLAVEVRARARDEGIRLRGVLLVPTEPGQSVNALVATSSRIIYVAEGLWLGLEREEIRAVLLHEVGHLGQPMTNLFRHLTALGWPAILAAGQVVIVTAADGIRAAVGLGLLLLLGTAGSYLVRRVQDDAETGADLFAERAGTPGALAAALGKLYSGDFTPRERRPPEKATAMVRERLRALEG